MDYVVNGRAATRQGNRLSYAAPHGVYPCLGSDRWVAITVFKDEEWHALARIIGDWAGDPKFATLSGRKEDEDRLDALMSKWTSSRDAQELENTLQAAGVPAQVVEKCSDLFADPQLKSRNYFVPLRHPEMGVRAYENAACYRLSKTPRNIARPSPCLGEHNEYVYKNLLGLTDDQISDYMAEGAITTPGAEGFRVSV